MLITLYTPLTILLLRMTTIPTVHLSLPDKLYEELRQLASSMGIQVTDLIKIFIKQGLYGNLQVENPTIQKLNSHDGELTYVKGKMYLIEKLMNDMMDKMDNLERRLEELESPNILARARRPPLKNQQIKA